MTRSNDKEVQYGSSVTVCDYLLQFQLDKIKPESVVDFGAGRGKNGNIVRSVLSDDVRVYAVEGCENTVNMLKTKKIYDVVFYDLIQNWIQKDKNQYHLAIFGDVLEHMKPHEIHAVIKSCHQKFKDIVIICPLHDIFQDDSYGNPLEVHQTYVTQGFFDRYNVQEKHIVKMKDYTIMNARILTEREKESLTRKIARKLFHWTMLILQPLGLARPLVSLLKNYGRKYKGLIRD